MGDKPANTDGEQPPIFRKARRIGCENRLMQVFLDDVETPGGEKVQNFLVLSPRQRSSRNVTGVAVLPILDGQFGLLKVYRYPVEDFVWEVPRGFVDASEDDVTAAVRELQEETGLTCEVADMVDLGIVTPEPGIIAARTHLYAATRCRWGSAHKEGEMGHKEFRLLNREAVEDMARDAITDTTTLTAWYRYLQVVR